MEDNSIKVIKELSPQTMGALLNNIGARLLIVKFTATWCRPCQTIATTVHECITQFPPDKLVFAELDVDENVELYSMMKTKRMVNGIPVMLAYDGKTTPVRSPWFVPDDSVTGGSIQMVQSFFVRCAQRVKQM